MVCFSIYSDISRVMRESSFPKRNSAKAFPNSVFPTPEGPKKIKEPIGRRGSLSPARDLRIARDTAFTASSWPISLLWISSSMFTSRCFSSIANRETGIPVQLATTAAISSSVTKGRNVSICCNQSSLHLRYFLFNWSSISLRVAASSKSCCFTDVSFFKRVSSICFSICFKISGRTVARKRTRLLASSMTSIALSGR